LEYKFDGLNVLYENKKNLHYGRVQIKTGSKYFTYCLLKEYEKAFALMFVEQQQSVFSLSVS